ncbi:MAG: phosphate ABC transporter permease PstA [Bacilli bacterium]|nr:phosphate ABC transporter permease PstA [Bacilli bacterium]
MSMLNKRKRIDFLYQGITYFASSISLIALAMIFYFVWSNGSGLLNLDLITKDYHAQYYNGELDENSPFSTMERPIELDENVFYSEKYGLGVSDGIDREGNPIILVVYVSSDSPLRKMQDRNSEQIISLEEDMLISKVSFNDKATALRTFGAKYMIDELDSAVDFREMVFTSIGGGIRGSIITTLYLIGMTMLVALPIGVFTAIYLNEFAKKNRMTNILRILVDTLSGVPSIIYGLMGLAVFVPLTIRTTSATSGNLISGSLTLAIILLPVIIKSTEESLKVVPDGLRQASLALGANETQTTFKVVLPSSIPGILTASLLGIGRIIGESAALIFAIGTAVKDDISITGKSTSLAVHIWSMMTDEPANIELSSTIAVIILMIVLILNIVVKFISKKLMKPLA